MLALLHQSSAHTSFFSPRRGVKKDGKGLYPVNVRAREDGAKLGNFRLKTLTHSFFNEYHDMFYVVSPSTGKYTKVVPALINDLMSPIALAHFSPLLFFQEKKKGRDG